MNESEKYIDHLTKELNDLEQKITNKDSYNKRNKKIKKRLKTGLTITFLLPAIVSSFLAYYGFKKINKTPFKIDKIQSYAKIITTTTNTQKHNEKIVYDETLNYSNTYEYSTAWKLNENNLYEREVYVYRINEDVENFDLEEILKMSYGEIKSFFILENKQKIQKLYLEEEDNFYDEDMFIVTEIKKDVENFKIKNESNTRNIMDSIIYICALIIIFRINSKKIKKSKIFNKIIKNNEEKYKEIVIDNEEELKEIIKIRKENMELFEEPKKYKI